VTPVPAPRAVERASRSVGKLVPGCMTVPGWFVGPLAATAALVVMGFVSLGAFYASLGGLFIAAGVAFWAGAGMAGIAEPRRWARSALIVAVYLVVLFAGYLMLPRSQSPPPGASRGGPALPRP